MSDSRVGVPLVAIDDLTFSTTTATGGVTIAQVQQQVYGAGVSTFTEAPYVFACGRFGSSTQVAFAECGAAWDGTFVGANPVGYVGASTTVSLTPAAGVAAADTLPALVEVLGATCVRAEGISSSAARFYRITLAERTRSATYRVH